MSYLPEDEFKKQDIWFKVKLLCVHDFNVLINKWVTENEGVQTDKKGFENEQVTVEPHESVSNVESKRSSKSSRSSSMSAVLQAKAEKAALVARAAALKEKHALEEKADQLRRQVKNLKIEAEMAAATAKLAAFNDSEGSSISSSYHFDGMESYLKRGLTVKAKGDKKDPDERGTLERLPSTSGKHPINVHSLCDETMGNHHMADKKVEHKPTTIGEAHHQRPLQPAQQTSHPITRSHSDSNASGDVLQLLQKQNDMMALLVETQVSHFLPHREIPVYTGNPLRFKTFMKAFD